MKGKYNKFITVEKKEWEDLLVFKKAYENRKDVKIENSIKGYIRRINEEKIPRSELDTLFILNNLLTNH